MRETETDPTAVPIPDVPEVPEPDDGTDDTDAE